MLRRTLEARAEAQARPEGQPQRNTPPAGWTPPPVRRGSMRSRLVPFALVALAAIVVVQTVYILRVRREAPAPATNSAPAMEPPVGNGNEPDSPERPAPPAGRARRGPRARPPPPPPPRRGAHPPRPVGPPVRAS